MSNEWQWMRVYYFEDCKDALILDGVWPAIRAACSSGNAAGFFQRKALGGPHVLIGIRNANPADMERARNTIRGFLEKHPSTTRMSAEDYARLSSALADWEQSGETSLQSNNTLQDCAEPHNLLVRPGEFQEAIRNVLSRSAELVVQWLKLVRENKFQRQDIVLHAMLAAAWVANPQKLTSCVSFGSHALGFFNKADPEKKLMASFKRKYETVGKTVRDFMRAAVQAMEAGENPIPGLSDWVSLLKETMSTTYKGLVSGKYEIASVMQFEYTEEQRRLISMLDESPALRAWQITINLVYLALNQLGLRALERFYACYLLFMAADDIYGGLGEVGRHLAEQRDTTGMLPFFNSLQQEIPAAKMKLYSTAL
jgi:hypothetical protein